MQIVAERITWTFEQTLWEVQILVKSCEDPEHASEEISVSEILPTHFVVSL